MPGLVERDVADAFLKETRKDEVQPSHMRNIWSINISSWFSHGEALLEEAENHQVHALLVQESGLTDHSIRGAAQWITRMGLSMKAVPKPTHGKGGVMILVKEPEVLGATIRRSMPSGN